MNTELGNKLDDISVAYGWPFDKSEHTFHVICTSDSNTGSILTRQTCADLSTSSMPFLFICYTRYVNIYIQTLNMIYVTIGIPCLTWSKIIHHVLNISCVPWILCPLSLYIVFFIKGLKLKQYLNNIGQK